jgi:hypothetical protein
LSFSGRFSVRMSTRPSLLDTSMRSDSLIERSPAR